VVVVIVVAVIVVEVVEVVATEVADNGNLGTEVADNAPLAPVVADNVPLDNAITFLAMEPTAQSDRSDPTNRAKIWIEVN
jgi:hypothetical protein